MSGLLALIQPNKQLPTAAPDNQFFVSNNTFPSISSVNLDFKDSGAAEYFPSSAFNAGTNIGKIGTDVWFHGGLILNSYQLRFHMLTYSVTAGTATYNLFGNTTLTPGNRTAWVFPSSTFVLSGALSLSTTASSSRVTLTGNVEFGTPGTGGVVLIVPVSLRVNTPL